MGGTARGLCQQSDALYWTSRALRICGAEGNVWPTLQLGGLPARPPLEGVASQALICLSALRMRSPAVTALQANKSI